MKKLTITVLILTIIFTTILLLKKRDESDNIFLGMLIVFSWMPLTAYGIVLILQERERIKMETAD